MATGKRRLNKDRLSGQVSIERRVIELRPKYAEEEVAHLARRMMSALPEECVDCAYRNLDIEENYHAPRDTTEYRVTAECKVATCIQDIRVKRGSAVPSCASDSEWEREYIYNGSHFSNSAPVPQKPAPVVPFANYDEAGNW